MAENSASVQCGRYDGAGCMALPGDEGVPTRARRFIQVDTSPSRGPKSRMIQESFPSHSRNTCRGFAVAGTPRHSRR